MKKHKSYLCPRCGKIHPLLKRGVKEPVVCAPELTVREVGRGPDKILVMESLPPQGAS